ncbi:MAG TPA: SDR family oxidoreductase [Meiothermus sp.]|nr:SDR family oxidoreductase [Meiothermus sp.]
MPERPNTPGRKTAAALAALAFAGALLTARRTRPPYSYQGKVVVVTGGSRGLGLVLGRMLADEGARLAICARDPEELERARAELAGRGAEVLSLPCDLTRYQEVRAFIQMVENHLGRIDVLINNAGVITVGPLEEMTPQDFREMMDTNFYGAVHTVLAALPGMLRRGQGRILNISSVGGLVPGPHLTAYSASKYALNGFSEGLRAELGRKGIVTTVVCPGEIRTGAHKVSLFKGRLEEEYAWFASTDVMPGYALKAEAVARAALEACRAGRALEVVGWPAKLEAFTHSLSPTLALWFDGLLNAALPKPDGSGRRALGKEINPSKVPEPLRRLGDEVARRNNEPGV